MGEILKGEYAGLPMIPSVNGKQNLSMRFKNCPLCLFINDSLKIIKPFSNFLIIYFMILADPRVKKNKNVGK